MLHLFVEGEAAIKSLFDFLNLDSKIDTSKNVGDIRRFLASVLGQLAESGLLARAIERFDVRSDAIAALASAVLSEEERSPGEDEDMTSHKLSTVLMQCLVDLCTVQEADSGKKKRIHVSATEAEAIAKNLGKKICQMVLSRFIERAKLQEYEIEEDEELIDAPDVAMMCAIAQHEGALTVLRAIGGLHALSLVAGEGVPSAMTALKKACSSDASILLEGDTYVSMLKLLTDDTGKVSSPELRASSFELLARLCSGSEAGLKAVSEAEGCQKSVRRAIDVISPVAHVSVGSDEASVGDQSSGSNRSEGSNALEATNGHGPPNYEEIAATGGLPGQLVAAFDSSLGLEKAACVFIASLVRAKECREELLSSKPCIEALSLLATTSENADLGFAALNVLVALAPYASRGGNVTPEDLASVFMSMLNTERKILATQELNANLLYRVVVSGASVIFDCIDEETQKSLASFVSSHFKKLVKVCSVTRSTSRELEKQYSAEFALSLSVALVLVRGKLYAAEILTHDLMTAMFHLMQWRHDSKTSLGDTDPRSWDAAIANCLLLLSSLLWRPQEVLDESGVKLDALAGTTLMLARPGKAPRKALDLRSVLMKLSQGQDSLSAVAAQSVAERLF